MAQPDGMLDLEIDPKLAWALRHRAMFPVDVNQRRPRGAAARAGARREGRRPYSGDAAAIVGCVSKIRPAVPAPIAKVRPFIVAEGWSPGGLTDKPALREKIVYLLRAVFAVLTMRTALLDLSAYTVQLAGRTDFAGWRDAARRLALADVEPRRWMGDWIRSPGRPYSPQSGRG